MKNKKCKKDCCKEPCNCHEQNLFDYQQYIKCLKDEPQKTDEQVQKDYAKFKRRVNRTWLFW